MPEAPTPVMRKAIPSPAHGTDKRAFIPCRGTCAGERRQSQLHLTRDRRHDRDGRRRFIRDDRRDRAARPESPHNAGR
jgi:hypothetical protein